MTKSISRKDPTTLKNHMKAIEQSYFIHAPLSDVWNALVVPKVIDAWGGGPVTMIDKVGEKFSLWGGSIWGVNKEVLHKKKLVQEWYSDSDNAPWDKPSLVTFMLHLEKDGVTLTLVQTNVPDVDAKDIEEGWKDYYLGPLKEYLEKK